MKETPKNSKIVAAFQAAQKEKAAHKGKTPFAIAYNTWEQKKLSVDTDKPGNPALRWISQAGNFVAVMLIDGKISRVYDATLLKTIGETEISPAKQKIIETEREELESLISLI